MPTTFCKSSYFGHNMLKTPVLPDTKLGFLDGLAGVSRYTVNLLFFPKRKNILHILQINPSFFCDLIHCKLRLGML